MLMSMPIIFPRALVQTLLAGAQDAPDAQRLGLLCGADLTHARVHWATVGEPLDMLLTRHADALATLITHPDTPPVPTAADRAQPRPPSQLLIIASLQTRGVLEMRAFDNTATDDNGLPITLF